MIKKPIENDNINYFLKKLIKNKINENFKETVLKFNKDKERYFNNEIKLLKEIKKLENKTIKNNKLNKYLKTKIFEKQIEMVYFWIIKVFGTKILE